MFIELIDDVKEQILSYCHIDDLKTISLTNRAYNEEMLPYLLHTVKIDLRSFRGARPELLKSVAKIRDMVVCLRLSFDHFSIPPAVCNAISSFQYLEELFLSSSEKRNPIFFELAENETADRTFAKLCKVNTLKTLKVDECRSITDEGFSHITELSRLKELHLINTHISDVGLSKVCELTTFECLHIVASEGEPSKFITDQGFYQISKLFRLTQLHIKCPEVGDPGFSRVCELPSLECLHIGGCRRITVKGFSHMKNLTKLRRFDAVSCEVRDDALAIICQLSTLETVHLCGSVTDCSGCFYVSKMKVEEWQRWLRMAKMKKMKNLAITGSDISESDVGLSKICELLNDLESLDIGLCYKLLDQGLCQILKLIKLKRLSMNCLRIGDAGLSIVCDLPSLEFLDISYCRNITDSGCRHQTKERKRHQDQLQATSSATTNFTKFYQFKPTKEP